MMKIRNLPGGFHPTKVTLFEANVIKLAIPFQCQNLSFLFYIQHVQTTSEFYYICTNTNVITFVNWLNEITCSLLSYNSIQLFGIMHIYITSALAINLSPLA